MLNDEEIIQLLNVRSENAICELEKKYGGLCRHLAENILHDRTEAENCLNDTLLGVWNAIPPAHPEMLSAYVCRIARNTALKRLEKLQAAKRHIGVHLNLDELSELLGECEDSPEKILDDRSLAECINSFLSSLPTHQRNVFVLRYWYNDDIKTIASKFGYSKSKVESMLHRMRNKLRLHLQQKGFWI